MQTDDADLIRCLKTVDKFLSGEGSIGGHWFGDKVNGKAFWWRACVGIELDRAIARIEALSAQLAVSPAWLLGPDNRQSDLDPLALKIAALIDREVSNRLKDKPHDRS